MLKSSSVIVIETLFPIIWPKLSAPSKIPSKVFFNSDPVPKATPLPKFKGLFSNDSAGIVKKFSNPVFILEATLSGADINVKDPTIENNYPFML